jgi:hypothetical protein
VTPDSSISPRFALGTLLRGDAPAIAGWIADWSAGRTLRQVAIIAVGAGAFGAAMGSWRSPWQAVFSAVKLPSIILATAGGNALVNGMFAPLLGLNLRMRESFAAVLLSYSLAATILGAFSPLIMFLVWNLPALDDPAARAATGAHGVMLLTLVETIAMAGIMANLRLLQLLRRLGGGPAQARRILWAWLAMNLLLGSQLSWILRPFIGTPGLPVEFLRAGALHGNFFESVLQSIRELWLRLSQP